MNEIDFAEITKSLADLKQSFHAMSHVYNLAGYWQLVDGQWSCVTCGFKFNDSAATTDKIFSLGEELAAEAIAQLAPIIAEYQR